MSKTRILESRQAKKDLIKALERIRSDMGKPSVRKRRILFTPGEVVKELRQKKGWTQAVLSDIVGMAVSNISNIERSRSRLGEDRAILLAEAFGVKPEFLLFPNGFEREDLKPRLRKIRKKLKRIKGKTAA